MTVENKNQDETNEPEMQESAPVAESVAADSAAKDQVLPKQQTHIDNKLFKDYYIMQGIVSVEELDTFIKHIKMPLPITFRVTGDSSNVKDVLRILKQRFIEKNGISLIKLPWYSDETAWQLSSEVVTADHNTAVNDFKRFIYQEAACGNLSQQDALSLLPPLLLNLQPQHKVLDMRAGTGQTVLQILDLLHADGKPKDLDGFVVASETDYRHCRELAGRLPKLTDPNFAILNLNDLRLQDLRLPTTDAKHEVVRYDRILCHLPSSGDGMFRKNLDGLRGWSTFLPFSYHGPLCQSLYSGLSQLAVGGRLVFYTDSMNPVENEAILYTVITQQRGSVELVDISAELPNILYEKGLNTWKVMAKGPRWFREHSEVPDIFRDQIWETMFPPPTKEEAEQFHLERCVRILPHRQNTAGLFLAVLTRTETLEHCLKREQEQYQAWLKAEEEKAAAERAAAAKAAAEKAAARRAARKAAADKAAAEKAEKIAKEKAAKEEAAREKRAAEEAAKEKDVAEETDKEKAVEEAGEEKTVEKADNETSEKEAGEQTAEEKTDKKTTAVENTAADSEKTDGEVSTGKSSTAQTVTQDTPKVEKDPQEVTIASDESNEKNVSVADEIQIENKTELASGVAASGIAGNESLLSETSSQPVESAPPAAVPEPMPVEYNNAYGYPDNMHLNEKSREDLLLFLTETDSLWQKIQDFFSLSKNFPMTQLAVRSRDNSCVFYLSSSLKSLALGNQSRITFVHAGVKLFCRISMPDSTCNYRLTQEGLPLIYPFLQRRVLLLPKQDFITMLTSDSTEMSTLSKETQKKLNALDTGSVVLVYKLDGRSKTPSSQLMISGWKDDENCRSFLPAYQRQHYLLACGDNFTPPEEIEPSQGAKEALNAFAQAMVALERS